MTFDELCARLAPRIGAAPDAARDLLVGLGDAAAEALERDGEVDLGPLGRLRLGVQPAGAHRDGAPRPMRPMAWFVAGPVLARRVGQVPLAFALALARRGGYRGGDSAAISSRKSGRPHDETGGTCAGSGAPATLERKAVGT